MKTDMYHQSNKRPILLLINNHKDDISEYSRIFEKNYRLVYSTTGVDAIVTAREHKPDVILLAVNMSDIDSFYICNTLKEDEITQDIPVILISRKPVDSLLLRKQTESIIQKGYQSGASDIIFPPLNPVCLQARLRAHVAFKLQSDYINSTTVIDSTTGLYNREKFNDFLNANWRLCMREQRPISLLMLNIDYFHEFRTRYGVEPSETCLKAVSDVLNQILKRPTDVCSHYKNEEFACLLPFTNLDGALKVANDILTAVRSLNIEHLGSKVGNYVTTSIGLSTMVPSNWAVDESKLVSEADLALYQCEQNGHNCVVVHA